MKVSVKNSSTLVKEVELYFVNMEPKNTVLQIKTKTRRN